MSHSFGAISCFVEPKESYYFLFLYDRAAFRTLGSIPAFMLHYANYIVHTFAPMGDIFYVLILSPVSSGVTILKSYSSYRYTSG